MATFNPRLSLLMQNTRSTPCTSKPRKSRQIRCDVKGCTLEGTFSRQWELRRHIQTKHSGESAVSFVCRAEGCFNKQLPWAFTRPDKLTSHIKANHSRDSVFTSCPVKGCYYEKNTLEILGVHLQRFHEGCEEGRGVLNAATYKMRKCPLWRCGKYVKTAELLKHVAGHDEDEVLAAASKLDFEGLVVITASGPSHMNDPKRGLVVVARCPVCNTTSDDISELIAHLWTSHLFLAQSAGVAHFIAWRSLWAGKVCKEVYSSTAASYADVNKLLPWATLKELPSYKSYLDTIKCPSCPFSSSSLGGERINPLATQRAANDAISAHHLSLLRPEAEIITELYPHRMQILRLYPEFVSHPVFADFDQPHGGIALSSQQPNQLDGAGNQRQTAMTGLSTPF